MLVLIVDDDHIAASSLADMINLLGHKTSIEHGPRQAMNSIQRNLPALILLDLNMPGVNGLEVCRFIKRDPVSRSTPVVFISAEDDPSVMKEAKEAGASGYMIKPVDFDSLEDVLEKTSRIARDSAPDGGKTKDSAPDGAKTKDSTLDGGKMKGSAPDTSKAEKSAPDTGKTEKSAPDTGKTKDSAHDTGKL